MRKRNLLALVSLALGPLAICCPASANHSLVERVSAGQVNGNGAQAASDAGSSADGTRVFYDTTEQLVSADTDSSVDVYQRSGAVTTLVSAGQVNGNGAFDAFYAGASGDGSLVFFNTREQLAGSDTDSAFDVYQRSAGTTTLVSAGQVNGNGAFNAFPRGTSDDGTKVFFESSEQLVSADGDSQTDVYERSGATTTLVSQGPESESGVFFAHFRGASTDGTKVFFDTDQKLTSGDTDARADVYQRSGATTTLISDGQQNGDGPYAAPFDGASADGTKVFFESDEQLVSADTDGATDIYERSGGTTKLVTAGAVNGNGSFFPLFAGNSDDGTRVFFETDEQLVASDTDAGCTDPPDPTTRPCIDVYERSANTTALVSAGANGTFDAFFDGASADGTKVFFETDEQLAAGDTDSEQDIYLRSVGVTALVSAGQVNGNGAIPSFFGGISEDGLRVFFFTDEQLVSGDTDARFDIYERFNGATTIVSAGLINGNSAFDAFFAGASSNGTSVFFHTNEALVNSDGDSAQDLYVAGIAPNYARPGSGTPLRVPLVPRYAQCTAPNSTHVAPKLSPGPGSGDPACNPPALESGGLKISTLGRGAGSLKLRALSGDLMTPADEADVSLVLSVSDVLRQSDGADYTGKTILRMALRITDRASGSGATAPATVSDASFDVPIDCTATAGAAGANCNLSTTLDAQAPGFAKEGKLALMDVLAITLMDAGPNGTVEPPGPPACPAICGDGDEKVFLAQGVFAP